MIRDTQPPAESDDHSEIAKALLARKVMMHRINLRPAGMGSA